MPRWKSPNASSCASLATATRSPSFTCTSFPCRAWSAAPTTQAYIDQYYTSFENVKEEGLDALIITGANVANPSLDQEDFWQPLTEVIEWARDNVTSTLCSCLSTHALMLYFHGIERVKRGRKLWGVFEHRVAQPQHPLLREINTRFDVPHSRWNSVTREHFENAGLTVLIQSFDGEVHMAVSPDQLRMVYFQGHPEYDINSLLKEYKRDLLGYFDGKNAQPPFPENYFPIEARELADRYMRAAQMALETGEDLPVFPEDHSCRTWITPGAIPPGQSSTIGWARSTRSPV